MALEITTLQNIHHRVTLLDYNSIDYKVFLFFFLVFFKGIIYHKKCHNFPELCLNMLYYSIATSVSHLIWI